MTEDDDVQAGRKQTLCDRYGIPDSHLDFKYVEGCNNTAELEKMVKILRSNEIGYFKELQEATEKRLRELAPNSRCLVTPERVSSWNELNTEQQTELCNEFLTWSPDHSDTSLEKLRQEVEETPRSYPAIRNSGKASMSNNETQVKREKPVPKSCAPRSYESWNNFNAEKEISLIDREEELKNNAAIRATNEKKNQRDESNNAVGFEELGAGDGHRQSAANDERTKGNEFYRERNFKEALHYYNRSICLSPTPEAYTNRAMSYIKLNMFEEAIEDCKRVQDMAQHNFRAVSKALYLQSTAFMKLNRLREANKTIGLALSIDPNDKDIQHRANELREMMSSPQMKKVRMVIEDKDSGCSNPLIEEIPQRNSYYPFTCASDTMAQSDIRTARQMCRCSGVPPFIAKLRSLDSLPNSNRLCLRKTRSKKSFNEKNLSNRRKKASGFTNGEIIEKDTIEDVEKECRNIVTSNLLSSLKTGDLESIFVELQSLSPALVCEELSGRLDPETLKLCVKALCSKPANWETFQKSLLALSKVPQFVSSVKSLDKSTKTALSERLDVVAEQGQRVSNIVTLYELNGANSPPSWESAP